MNLKSISISLLVCMFLMGCHSESTQDFSFHIDSTIKQKAIAHFKSINEGNRVNADYGYFLDSLRLTVDIKSGMMLHPVFFWLNFNRKNNRQFLYGCGHTGPVYKFKKYEEPKQCIEVPLLSGELTLSSMPDTNSKEPVYGYLKFKSQRYYSIDDNDYREEQTEFDNYFIADFRKAIK